MPLPTPNDNESQEDFVSRCMAAIADDDTYESEEQRTAVCHSQYRKSIKGVKIIDEAKGIIGGWGIPFGGPVKGGKDLDGEWFTKDTNFCLDWFPEEGRPVLYQHGLDDAVKLVTIGRQVAKSVDPEMGIWVETQLNLANRYSKLIMDLAKKGVLGYSSGALQGYTRRKSSGEITQWPWVEQSLTPIPANPYAIIPSEAVKHLSDIGWEEELPMVLRGAKKLTLPDGMSMNDLREKLESAVKEIPGFDDDWCWCMDVRDGFAIMSVEDGYIRYPFTIAGGEVKITGVGEKVERQETWVPSTGKDYSNLSARNKGQLHEVMTTMKDLHDAACDMGDDCPLHDAPSEETASKKTSEGPSLIPDIETAEQKARREEVDRLLANVTLVGRG